MNATLSLDIPAETLASARMTLEDIRLELAILLFRLDRLSLGKAAEFALLPVGAFQNHLASRRVGPHYDVADALEDAAVLASLPR
jgi:predicted HTH domain antitoxin